MFVIITAVFEIVHHVRIWVLQVRSSNNWWFIELPSGPVPQKILNTFGHRWSLIFPSWQYPGHAESQTYHKESKKHSQATSAPPVYLPNPHVYPMFLPVKANYSSVKIIVCPTIIQERLDNTKHNINKELSRYTAVF